MAVAAPLGRDTICRRSTSSASPTSPGRRTTSRERLREGPRAQPVRDGRARRLPAHRDDRPATCRRPTSTATLSVLAEDGRQLVVRRRDRAASRRAKTSARCASTATAAFVVTFKKTDPLFAFDLAEPARAAGSSASSRSPASRRTCTCSTTTHLLTIGYDADDHGSFAYFDGVHAADLRRHRIRRRPTLAHKHIIGTRGSSSEALTNHLAFTWYPEEALLALPMTICEGGDDGTYGQTHDVLGPDGVRRVASTLGFAEHGRVPMPSARTSRAQLVDERDLRGQALAVPRPIRLFDLRRRAQGPLGRRPHDRACDGTAAITTSVVYGVGSPPTVVSRTRASTGLTRWAAKPASRLRSRSRAWP